MPGGRNGVVHHAFHRSDKLRTDAEGWGQPRKRDVVFREEVDAASSALEHTLTTHSPSCRRLRGVSIIGRPQLAQVGDFGMAVGECGVWCGCSALPVLPVAFVVKRRCEINSDCELF